jgi:hypothetical protein
MGSDDDGEWRPEGQPNNVPPKKPACFPPSFVRMLGKQVLADGSRLRGKMGRPEAPGGAVASELKRLDGTVLEESRTRSSGKFLPHFRATD